MIGTGGTGQARWRGLSGEEGDCDSGEEDIVVVNCERSVASNGVLYARYFVDYKMK